MAFVEQIKLAISTGEEAKELAQFSSKITEYVTEFFVKFVNSWTANALLAQKSDKSSQIRHFFLQMCSRMFYLLARIIGMTSEGIYEMKVEEFFEKIGLGNVQKDLNGYYYKMQDS